MNRIKQVQLKCLSEGYAPSDLSFSGTALRYGISAHLLKKPELTGVVQFRIEERRMFMKP